MPSEPAESPDEPRTGPPRVVLAPADAAPVTVRVEVADTEAARRRGLMWRRHLPPDAGMLFVFDRAERQSFWMRNTFLALDMIFIGENRRVVGVVAEATPLTEEERAVDAPSRYVLEVHAGFAREHGIEAGTPVRFVNVPEDR
ncbi:MAG TPA: DUF192 domain-containing protein [Sandaracinaceae bacterium LLY-WYZ-13_1]|nr:DUF192 domain-containing protein [Sandaracinaceae bacterium LLY-WYZ-13_1]